MLNLVRPKHFIPIHGEYRMLVTHAGLAQKTGVPPRTCFVIENGDVLEFTAAGAAKVGKTYGGNVMVDGSASATSARPSCATASISRPTAS
jgi:ribonuclease J